MLREGTGHGRNGGAGPRANRERTRRQVARWRGTTATNGRRGPFLLPFVLVVVAALAACSFDTVPTTPTRAVSTAPAPTALPTATGRPAANLPATTTTRTTSAPATPSRPPASATAMPATPGAATATATRGTAGPGAGSSYPGVVDLAIAVLAGERGIPATEIEVVRVEPREWPNSSLGCPEPGRAYLDVITPGYAITLRVRGGGALYEYHSDEVRLVVRCQGGSGDATPSPRRTPMTNLPPAARTAVATLANELGIRQDEISVASVDEAEWSDSSLGCPEPGRAYLQVITPGYRVVLIVRGQRYVYHTDRGTRVVRCAHG